MTRGDVERVTGFRRVDVWSLALCGVTLIVLSAVRALLGGGSDTLGPAGSTDGVSATLTYIAMIVVSITLGSVIATRVIEHRWPGPPRLRLRRGERANHRWFGSALLTLMLGNFVGIQASQLLRDFGTPPGTYAMGWGYLITDGGAPVHMVHTSLPQAISLVGFVGGFFAGWIAGLALAMAWDAMRGGPAKAARARGLQDTTRETFVPVE